MAQGKWEIKRVTHIQTYRGTQTAIHSWWLIKPRGMFQDFVAQKVGTFEECRQEFIRATREPTCCGGGPQWGHKFNCPKCPD